MPIIEFEQALAETAEHKRHLLLGNGFSIALFADRFHYGSLLNEADFTDFPEARRAFTELGTADFEVVIQALRNAVTLLPLYATEAEAIRRMSEHAEALKELLVQAIAGRHPERPSDITEDQYRACRAFLAHFVGERRNFKPDGGKDRRASVYTFNYDLLLYWTLLHDQVIRWDGGEIAFEDVEELQHDDGFRAPDEDPAAAFVTWDAEGGAISQNIHFLHGGLHLYDYGAELQKKCWERAGGIPLVDQIRAALDSGKFPLFVAEGSTEGKLTRIRHSGYLQRSLRSFAQSCRNRDASLFVFGLSLSGNDEHVLRHIEKGTVPSLYVSIFGDPDGDLNRGIITRALRMADVRNDRFPLNVVFYSAESARVWG